MNLRIKLHQQRQQLRSSSSFILAPHGLMGSRRGLKACEQSRSGSLTWVDGFVVQFQDLESISHSRPQWGFERAAPGPGSKSCTLFDVSRDARLDAMVSDFLRDPP